MRACMHAWCPGSGTGSGTGQGSAGRAVRRVLKGWPRRIGYKRAECMVSGPVVEIRKMASVGFPNPAFLNT